MPTPPLDAAQRDILRKLPNPFSETVRPQYSDGNFDSIHVPEVFADQRRQLLAAIDSYRVAEYTSARDLPPSRMVTVLGPRGAGKTHLLESLVHRTDFVPQLLITRQSEGWDGEVAFEEYLFQLFLEGLLAVQPRGFRYFDLISAHLCRQILLQTIRSLAPLEKAQTIAPRAGWRWLRMLYFGGADTIVRQFDDLADELERPGSSEQLSRLEARFQLNGADLAGLALTHLERSEPGKDILSAIRREFYSAIVRSALLGHRDALDDFLEADYQPPDSRFRSRDEVVRQLLFVLVEACALVRLPVVFAFDNLESLFSFNGQFDPKRASGFLAGVAQVIDHMRGILFVLFAESMFNREMVKASDRFALDRVRMGVNLPGQAPLSEVNVSAATEAELVRLTKIRMKNNTDLLPNSASLPATFPFAAEFLQRTGAKAGPEGQSIRIQIDALRDEYNRLIFGDVPPPVAPPPQPKADDTADLRPLFNRAWKDATIAAERRLQASLPANSQALTRALGSIAECASSLPDSSRPLLGVRPAERVGDDPRYGFVTVLEYGPKEKVTRLAVGFLLASTRGMAVDLSAKLAAFQDSTPPNHLYIFWPTPKSTLPIHEQFQGHTLQAWNDAKVGKKATVKKIELSELQSILAFSLWRDDIQKQAPNAPADSIRAFVLERFARLLDEVQPPAE
jgi:hypothetical protein